MHIDSYLDPLIAAMHVLTPRDKVALELRVVAATPGSNQKVPKAGKDMKARYSMVLGA